VILDQKIAVLAQPVRKVQQAVCVFPRLVVAFFAGLEVFDVRLVISLHGPFDLLGDWVRLIKESSAKDVRHLRDLTLKRLHALQDLSEALV